MANRNQQRGGQHAQEHYSQGSRNQMGGSGQGDPNQQSAFQGNQGQFGGNYGPDTNYQGSQPYGNHENQGGYQGYNRDPNTNFGNNSQTGGQSGNSANYGLSRDAGYNPRETNANDLWEAENSRGPRGYGHSQGYGGPLSHPDDVQRGTQGGLGGQQQYNRFQQSGSNQGGQYNPSLNTSRGGNEYGGYEANYAGQHHDPDYHQWRNEQIRGLDNDYKAWREERYSNFSNEFGEWRRGRQNKQSTGGSSSGSQGSGESDSSSTTGNASQGSAGTSPKGK